MRHKARFGREQAAQDVVDLDGVDRGEPQARQLGQFAQDRACQGAERRLVRQVAAIAGEVDAGEHDFSRARLHQASTLDDHAILRKRARIPAAEGDDAEGAAMVAAVLDLDEAACMAGEAAGHRGPQCRARHDVADIELVPGGCVRVPEAVGTGEGRPALGVELLVIAEDAVRLRHGREARRFDLGGAAGDDDRAVGLLALR